MATRRGSLAVTVLLAAASAALVAPGQRALAGDPVICYDKPITIVVPASATYHIRDGGESVRGLGTN
jgi:hypothetical protein